MNLEYFLPAGEFQAGIPEPAVYLGHQVGEWNLSHDRLAAYLKELAGVSDRVVYQEYARSHEHRPLFHLIITSPANHRRLEAIRGEHLLLSDPERSGSLDTDDMPVVVRLGYGVHGNESSASNASVLVAYYLAASRSQEVEAYLENMIILLDPCLNPDGFNRHASWINMHKSRVPMKDSHSRGFREPWPGGRTNHYWFDLNRDWILLQHPESRGRVKVFHDWKPNVQTDHHEMGPGSSFFFQPGVPTRINPYTPEAATKLTARIGQYHAKALDGTGSLYYTEERFDDFYYGKGSSYPDVNGSIGILFEQAGTRGFERETGRGVLTFPYAIRNQVSVSLSSLEASFRMRKELLDHQRDFYSGSPDLYAASREKAYVFGENGDPSIRGALLDVLLQHQIEVRDLSQGITLQGQTFRPGTSFLVSLDQPQFRLIKSLFEPVTAFEDSLFYDVSTWTFPYAYNVPYAAINDERIMKDSKGPLLSGIPEHTGAIMTDESSVGYLFSWNDYHAPRVLHAILDKGLVAQVVTDPITYQNHRSEGDFGYGTIFVPVEKQERDGAAIREILEQASRESGIEVHALSTSYTIAGADMGSERFIPLRKPGILLLTGEGVSSLEAGEIWHLLDIRMQIPVVLLDATGLDDIDLGPYTHVIMPSGDFGSIPDQGKMALKQWLEKGGTIIALKSANQWLARQELVDITFKEIPRDTTGYKPYAELGLDRGAKRLTGSIFEAEVDISHPIGYGLERGTIPVFRNSTLIPEAPCKPYAVPLRYTDDPLLSGYVPTGLYDHLRGAPSVIVSSRGQGRVISFFDNPNFRGFWYGTNRLFMNAIFFGPIISSSSTR